MDIRFKPYMLFPVLPLLAIGIFSVRYHQDIFSFYLPNSLWNDEVIYFKTVEGITEYGIPHGYFGYNESHASIGTFGAWSPVIFIFDAIWGDIFGWNLLSPVIARVIFSTVAMIIFAAMCKPKLKEIIRISLYTIGFSLYARYLVSQMVDCYIVGLTIIFVAIYKRKDEESSLYSISIIILIVFLTLMRPYFFLLWLPVYSFKDKKMFMIEFIVGMFSLVGYFALSKYMTAAYFSNLINFTWLKLIFESPFVGLMNLVDVIHSAFTIVNVHISSAFSLGDGVGGQYFLFYILTFVFLLLCVFNEENRLEWGAWLAVNVAFWFAVVLLYDVRVGSRHIMPFIIMEGFVILERDISRIVPPMLIVIVWYIFLIKLTDPYLMTYPTYNYVLDTQIQEMREELVQAVRIDKGNRWNNTILWVISDNGGGYPWQTLYALPAGMGINICSYDYVITNFDNLDAKYIACTASGDVAVLCEYSGYKRVLERSDANACIFEKNKSQ